MLEFGDGRGSAFLQQLPAQRGGELTHGDDLAVLRSEEGGIERHIADTAAGELELCSQEREIDIRRERRLAWEDVAP